MNKPISTRNLEADDSGIRFDVMDNGELVRAHISYVRLLGRKPSQAERALPPKYLFEERRDLVQSLVDRAAEYGLSGPSRYMID